MTKLLQWRTGKREGETEEGKKGVVRTRIEREGGKEGGWQKTKTTNRGERKWAREM